MMARRRNPFPHVARVTDRHGGIRWRFRRGPVDCYLPGAYGSAEFVAAYEKAITGARPDGKATVRQAAPGTIDWLILRFYNSPDWTNLRESSRPERRRFWERLRAEHGSKPFALLTAEHVKGLARAKADRPTAANMIVKRLRQLFRVAMNEKLVERDPTAGLRARMYREREGGYRTWTDADIAAFEAKHPAGSQARLALRLMLYTGAARQDVVRFGWPSVKAGRISYRRGKTEETVDLPIHHDLAEELAHVPPDRLLFLITHYGKAHTAKGFGNTVKDWCRAAGLPEDCSAHGLRKAGGRRLAESGATENEIAAFLGHRDTRTAATYTKAAGRALLGDAAIARLSRPNREHGVSNISERLDKLSGKPMKEKGN